MQKMMILVFFMTVCAWCTSVDAEIEIPSFWVQRAWGDNGGAREVRSPLGLGLSKLRVWPTKGKDVTLIADSNWNFQCEVPEIPMNAGCAIFKIHANCRVCNKPQNAFVFFSQPRDLPESQYRLTVILPNEKTITPPPFHIANMKQTQNVCAYRAEEDSFSVTRFVCQYSEESQLFVRTTFSYSDFSHVSVSWGETFDQNGAEPTGQSEDLWFTCCRKPSMPQQPRFGVPYFLSSDL